MTPTATPTPLPLPYTVAIDNREQTPYAFTSPFRIGTKTFTIPTAPATLSAGDYSIIGHTQTADPSGGIAIERKSLADAFGTFGRGRERFERELVRLSAYRFAAVVVEAEWSTVLTAPPARSKLRPRSVLGSVVAWQCRYPNVQWVFLPGRDVAEAYTARLLDRFWRERAMQILFA
jgi:ERCC4-type nuclease